MHRQGSPLGGAFVFDPPLRSFLGTCARILAPVAAMLFQMAISRTRGFSADGAAAKYTGTPGGLNSAPGKLEGWSKRIPMDASPPTASMFIIKPFTGDAIFKLFSTHTSTEDRIACLQAAR